MTINAAVHAVLLHMPPSLQVLWLDCTQMHRILKRGGLPSLPPDAVTKAFQYRRNSVAVKSRANLFSAGPRHFLHRSPTMAFSFSFDYFQQSTTQTMSDYVFNLSNHTISSNDFDRGRRRRLSQSRKTISKNCHPCR